MSDDAKRPIYIKRVAHEEDEHGGHWKIAYADFVTAMMAFFLVMWLLASVDDKSKRGIARYFSSTSIVDMRTGDGVMDGSKSALNGANDKMVPISTTSDESDTDADAVQDIATATGNKGNKTNSGGADAGASANGQDRTERQQMDAVKAEVERLEREGELKDSAGNIQVDMTPDGLRVQIFDRDGAPMFAPGSGDPNRRLCAILDALAPVLGSVRNAVVITGHTDSQPLQRASYGNWELSADRANGTRRYMEAHGIEAGRIVKVEGRANADPLMPDQPNDPRNRRIALTLLRNDVAARMRSAPPHAKGT